MAQDNAPMNYDERIAGQQGLVDKLAEDYKKKPTEELRLDLKRKTDTLLHLKNMAKENPMERAKRAAEKAKHSVLGKAVTRIG